MSAVLASAPLVIRMHERDNVAIVANDGGLPAGTEIPNGPTLRDKVPQGHKVALVDIAQGEAVHRYDVTIGTAARDIAAGSWVHERLLQMPAARTLDRPADGHGGATARRAAHRPHLRGLPQRRRLGRHAQPAGHHHHRAMRGRRGRPRGRAHPQRAAAEVPARRRRGRAGAHLWLRRGDRRAGRRDPDPHAAPHQPEPQLRRRGDGGEPGLREAAARAAAAAGQHRAERRRRRARRGVPAGQRPRRLPVDDRFDPAPGRPCTCSG